MKKYSRKLIVAALLTSAVATSIVNISANTHAFKESYQVSLQNRYSSKTYNQYHYRRIPIFSV